MPGRVQMLLRIIYGKLTVLTASALTTGGLAALVMESVDKNPWTGFVFGALLPLGPVLIYYATPWALRRELSQLVQLKADGLLTDRQFKALRKGAVDYYRQIRFGQASLADTDEDDS